MGPVVFVQAGCVEEGFATARLQAGKGSDPGVDSGVCVQVAALCEGFATVRFRADKGSLSCVDFCVCGHAALYEGCVTARLWADTQPIGGRGLLRLP